MKHKVKRLVKCLLLVAVISVTTGNCMAQDLKSILGNVVKNVVEDQTTTSTSIVGTWTYVGPDCQFESDNLLAKAGGEVAAKKVEDQLLSIYDKVGMEGFQYTFGEDGSYSCTIKGKTTSGTYTFDSDAKTITMKSKFGIKLTAYVTVTGSNMSLVFKADKLMSVLKAVTGAASGVNTTASAINSIATSYDGIRLGFELKK